jgi:hypothetical protein
MDYWNGYQILRVSNPKLFLMYAPLRSWMNPEAAFSFEFYRTAF